MRWIKIALLMLALAVGTAAAGWTYWQHRLDAPIALSEPTVFAIEPGTGAAAVLNRLERRGVIDGQWPYKVLAVIEPQRLRALRAGEFRLTPDMDAHALIDKLSSNDVVTYRLTIPEGRTFAQMRDIIARADLVHESADMSDEEIMAALGHEGEAPEGRFFPDTYIWRRGVSDLEIYARAYERMARHLDEVWAARQPDLPIDSPYEALILASLIERETGAPEERTRIAGVFKRRLEQGMRLQTDPTVIYGLGEAYDGSLSRDDLTRPTPWNTYVISGLPPTPIAMPGLASLEAAVDPAPGDALYFVSRGDGRHKFSATLAEHNAAVRRYILGEEPSP